MWSSPSSSRARAYSLSLFFIFVLICVLFGIGSVISRHPFCEFAEWMGLFKNAEYVVSDSFHGIVYSLLFNRKFFAMVNGHHMNRRVEQLLKLVNLSDRTIDNVSYEGLTEEIDFTYANEQLAGFRQHSLEHLRKLVEDEQEENADK